MQARNQSLASFWAVSLWLLSLALLGGACGGGRVKLDVRVEGLTAEMTTLEVSLSGGGLLESMTRKHSQGLEHFVVSFDAAAAGAGPLTLDLVALDMRACGVAQGQESAVPVISGTTVTVRLVPFSENRCQLQVRKIGTGSGRVYADPAIPLTEPGVDCDGVGPRCKVSHTPRQELSLYAKPSEGSFFVGWSGNVSSCQGLETCRVTTLDGALDIRATFLPRTSCRPDGWCWEQPKPSGATIYGIYGASPNQVWAVGDGGTILLWNGVLWANYDSPVLENLHGIWGSGKDDIWAVGNNATILHWDGLEWRKVPQPFPNALAAVHGSSAHRAVAVGTQGMYVEWDGGEWRQRQLFKSHQLDSAQLLSVWVDDTEAWAIIDPPAGSMEPRDNFVQVTGEQVRIWQGVTRKNLRRLFGVDSKQLWAITLDSLLSYDGEKWTEQQGPTSPLQPAPVFSYLAAIWGTGKDNLWVAGNLGPYFRLAADGFKPSSVTQGTVQALYGFGANDIFAAGEAGLLSRWNGTQWVPQSEQSYHHYQSLFALSPKKVFAASTDGIISEFDGHTWRPRYYLEHGITALWGTGPDNLWAVGLGRNSYQYDPVGDDWKPIDTGVFGVLSSASGGAPDDIWAVGQENDRTGTRTGILLHWDGMRWTRGSLPTGFLPLVIWDTGGEDVWVGGQDGGIIRIIRTNTGTYKFVQHTFPELIHDIETIWGSSPNDLWLAGSIDSASLKDSVILHWDGGTLTLDRDTFLPFESIRKIWGTSKNNVWASGAACLLHYDGKDWSRTQGVQTALLDFVNLAPALEPPDILAVGPNSVVMRRKGY